MVHPQGHPKLEPPRKDTNDEQSQDSAREANHRPSIVHHQNHALLLEISNDGAGLGILSVRCTNRSGLQPADLSKRASSSEAVLARFQDREDLDHNVRSVLYERMAARD